MAKIILSSETLDKNRRRPGYALLKISGWKHSSELTELSILRSQDDKYLSAEGQWEPVAVWHSLANMVAVENDVIAADVPPAFVDPIISAPNNSYRVTLKSGDETETRTMKITHGIFASSAAGSSPESSEYGNGLILGAAVTDSGIDADSVQEPELEAESAEKSESVETQIANEDVAKQDEETPPPVTIDPVIQSEPEGKSFFVRHKWKLVTLVILLILAAALALAWYFKLLPGIGDGGGSKDSGDKSTIVSDPPKQLTDLELLQQFMRSNPDTEQILAQAEAWRESKHCDAMLRLMVHTAHKSNDSRIALEYAKLHDPSYFKGGECIEEADPETAQYWYQKAAEEGNSEAVALLEKLNATKEK
jgi:hypothetical protein